MNTIKWIWINVQMEDDDGPSSKLVPYSSSEEDSDNEDDEIESQRVLMDSDSEHSDDGIYFKT